MTFRKRNSVTLVRECALALVVIFFGYAAWKFNSLQNAQTHFDNLDEAMKFPEHAKVLIIRNQSILTLPKTISQLTNLRVLNLANNQLKELPEEIGDLYNLEELSCENNLLTKLPESIRNLKKLSVINLDNNLFAEVPPELYELGLLRRLSLARNKVTQTDIGAFRDLEYLDLSENDIVELAISIHHSSSIKKIDLFNNKLKSVPKPLFSIERLDELILSGNPLDTTSKALYELFIKSRQ